MLYRIHTNTFTSHYNSYITSNSEDGFSSLDLNQYEYLSEEDQGGGKIPNLVVRLLHRQIDTSGLETERCIKVSDENKDFDVLSQPDFRTTNPLPTITERCKEFIEQIDPDVHQFQKFKLYHGITGEVIDHTNFYFFICGRLLEIVPDASPLTSDMTDIPVLSDTNSLHTIVRNKELQEFVETLPLWCLFRKRNTYYSNADFIQNAKKNNLIGFEETEGNTTGDIQHVWY